MITNSFIRSLTIDKTYRKGMQIFLEKDRILELNIEMDEICPELTNIDALVKGTGRNYYDVSLAYNEEEETLEDSYCECPAFSSYAGICKHCVAVLMEYMTRQKGTTKPAFRAIPGGRPKRQEPVHYKPQTTYAVKNLLSRRTESRTAPILQRDTYGHVCLEPMFRIVKNPMDTQLFVEFKIGAGQMYVLKDVFEFADRLRDNSKYAYGKKLEFTHTLDGFDPESRQLAAFLAAWTKKNGRQYSSYYYSQPKAREIKLTGAEFEAALDALGQRSFAVAMQGEGTKRWTVSDKRPEIEMRITTKDGGIEVEKDSNLLIQGERNYLVLDKGEIYKLPMDEAPVTGELLSCMDAAVNNPFFVAEEDLPAFCREFLPELQKNCKVVTEDFDEEAYKANDAELKIYLDAPHRDVVTGKVEAVYGSKKYNAYDRTKDSESRDLVKEIEGCILVSSYFSRLDEVEKQLVIDGSEEMIYELLTSGVEAMQQIGEVYVSEKLKSVNIRTAPPVSVGLSLSGDLLELTMTAGDMTKSDLVDILSRYSKKKKYYRLRNGDFIRIEDDGLSALAELKEGLNLSASQMGKDTLVLPKFRAMYLDSELREKSALSVERSRDFRALIRDMKTVEDNDFEIPPSLAKILREYQKLGFLWLKTLAYNGFGGILADDMGLGKTLQVIAYLLSEQEEKGEAGSRPSLIVCPASLVYNWESELHRFAPDLATRLIIGTAAARQTLIEGIQPGEVCVTSYELLKRDIGLYGDLAFGCQVVDEAQYIKNHNTQAAKSVKSINAGFRIALTGTPVENRLSELWSIFDFLMPGFLHAYDRFRKEVETPIVQGQDEEVMERLRKMTHPFILRRLKKDVLKDLPDKIEKNMFTRMDGEQQKLYDAHVKQLQLFLDGASDEELSTSKIQILSQLTRLRQICCDPALVYEDYKGESAKTQMCVELISNAVSAGHKILLFSQFTTMLSDLEGRLEDVGISYYILTGATSKEKRNRLVKAFNEDDTSVFLISLKAGGTGLNLTAADMVIHFDPWWNLAVQNQATDRAHRIGQKNVVTVYKLIAQDTIEDKILELQERKKNLADQILTGRGVDSVSFDREELMELLRKS